MKVATSAGGYFSGVRQQVKPKPRTEPQPGGRPDDRSRIHNAFRALCGRTPNTATPGQCVRRPVQSAQPFQGLVVHRKANRIPLPDKKQQNSSAGGQVPDAWALALPDLAKSDFEDRDELEGALTAGLLELQKRLAAAGADDDAFPRLVSVLCDHARIRDFASMDPQRTLEGLKALVDVMCQSIRYEPGGLVGDGLALNMLVGLDSKLDGALIKLRVQCVRDFMLSQSAKPYQATYCTVPTAAADAEQLVALEADLAKARVQMLQAFEAAGIPRTMGGMAGQKMTTTLVRGIRNSLGEKKARQVGLAIAHVYLLERKISESACGKRMLDDAHRMRIGLVERARDADRSTPDAKQAAREMDDEIRYLEQRADGLQQEDAACGVGGLTDIELECLGLPPAMQDFVGPELEADAIAREAVEMKTRDAICKLASQGLSGAAQTDNAVKTINAVTQAWLGAGSLEKMAQGGGLDLLCGGKGEDRARRFGQRLMKHTLGARVAEMRKLSSIVQEEIEPVAGLHAVKNAKDRQTLNELLGKRREMLSPQVADALRDAIRAAALLQMPAVQLHKFIPADHASAVLNTLVSWGIDTDLVRPEIDACLGEAFKFDVDTLDRWIADAALPPEQVDAQTAHDALLKGIDEMNLGTRIKMVAGERVEVQTGYIPVEPTMIAEVNIKGGAVTSTGLEIAHISDAGQSVFELTFRAGFDLKLGLEVWANLAGSRHVGIDFDAMSATEGSYQRLKGVSLRFSSRKALKEALDLLLASAPEKPIAATALDGANSILPLVDRKRGGKTGVGLKVGIDMGTQQVGGDPESRHIGATASLRAMLSAGGSRSKSTSLNTLESIEKSEREIVVEGALMAMAGVEFKAGPSVDRTTYSTVLPAVQASVSLSSVVKRKGKILRGRDGLVQQGTERMSQAYLPPGGVGFEAAGRVGGKAFVRLLQTLKRDDKPAADAILALIANVRTNELFSVASTLDPDIAEQVNALYRQARNHRTGRAGSGTNRQALRQAKELERQARALLDDEFSYLIERIAIVPTMESSPPLESVPTKERVKPVTNSAPLTLRLRLTNLLKTLKKNLNLARLRPVTSPAPLTLRQRLTDILKTLKKNLNLGLVQKSAYVEERAEYVAEQVKPDLAISRRVRDELRELHKAKANR